MTTEQAPAARVPPRTPPSLRSLVPLLALVVAWAVVGWLSLRPPSLVGDWNGWRQADTQTIAMNLAKPEGRLLYPQIAWGGDGTGYVEAELQLYTALVAPVLRLAGPAEWPGQLVSLILYAGAGVALGFLLRERFGPFAALLGTYAFLSTRAALHLSTSVQPESLVVLLFVLAWGTFLRFEATTESRFLILFALTGALAMMVKPSAAQIGIATFALVALRSRHLLKSPRLWIAWLGMVACLIAYLLFAREIFLVHGNTFGVLSGGDSKLPRLEHLVRPGLFVEAARVAILWGVGPVGALVAFVLGVRGRLAAEALALVPGAAAWTLLTLRYSSEETFGSHYSVLAGVIGGWCVAQAGHSLEGTRWRSLGLGALALAVAVQYATSMSGRLRHHVPDRGAACVLALAEATRGAVAPGDLIVVRAGTFAYDRYWKTPNNYQDPRPFYLAGARGWVLGSDEDDPAVLEGFVARGARAYLEPDTRFRSPAIDRWLVSEARPIATTACGRAFALPERRRDATPQGPVAKRSGGGRPRLRAPDAFARRRGYPVPRMASSPVDLAPDVLRGDVRAVARAISIVENGRPGAAELLARLFPHAGRSLVVGVTGPPGAGKSTLVDRMTAHLRKQGRTVGVVAVDPTSPYTGGAILGDRIRMQAHALDSGVFIRSMATRGHLGGLAAATGQVLTVLAGSGKEVILLETVGVGQDEVEIVGTADVSIVVLVPGLGDEVQALKAGIMEIADIFVVNKADREGAERVVSEIESMLSLAAGHGPVPAIVKTVASQDRGISDVLLAIGDFRRQAESSGLLARRRRAHLRQQFEDALRARLTEHVLVHVLGQDELERTVDALAAGSLDPLTAAHAVLRRMGMA